MKFEIFTNIIIKVDDIKINVSKEYILLIKENIINRQILYTFFIHNFSTHFSQM